jgi:EAL domain-containing protein (putative c-di-GMP-specific phosphodiesterase class I)
VANHVFDALRTTGCEPHWISFELTERLLLEDVPLDTDSITRLREPGVGIAIDDSAPAARHCTTPRGSASTT